MTIRWPDHIRGPHLLWNDAWVGAYLERRADGSASLYVCLLPCLPIRFDWEPEWWRKAQVKVKADGMAARETVPITRRCADCGAILVPGDAVQLGAKTRGFYVSHIACPIPKVSLK